MDDQEVLSELRRFGFALMPPIERIAETIRFLEWCPVYRDAHIPETGRKRGDHQVVRAAAQDSRCVCVTLKDTLRAPHILERAIELTDVARAYLGEPVLAYSANAFWTRPAATSRPDIQDFHHDRDDRAFLVMFVYLTDVLRPEDGAHELIGPDGKARLVFGYAGTVFLADTRLEHRGRIPMFRERGIAWVRWGVSDPPEAYRWDGNEPIAPFYLGDRWKPDDATRAAFKLLVRP